MSYPKTREEFPLAGLASAVIDVMCDADEAKKDLENVSKRLDILERRFVEELTRVVDDAKFAIVHPWRAKLIRMMIRGR